MAAIPPTTMMSSTPGLDQELRSPPTPSAFPGGAGHSFPEPATGNDACLRTLSNEVRDAVADGETLQRLNESLRESEERYRKIIASVTDYIYSVKVEDGEVISTGHGPGCVAVTGYSVDEFMADPFLWLKIVDPQDRPLVIAQAKAVLESDTAQPLEHRIRKKDGSVRWMRNTPVRFTSPDGKLLGYDGLIQDITELRRAEEEQRSLLARLRAQQKMIVEMATHQEVLSGDLVGAMHVITEKAAHVVQVERVGIWLLAEEQNEFRCANVYCRKTETHSCRRSINRSHLVHFLEALNESRAIHASDAHGDPKLRELLNLYLEGASITSVISAGVRISGRLVGAVVFEHGGTPRTWKEDEIIFAGEVADNIAQAVLNNQRSKAELQLRESEANLAAAQHIAKLGSWELVFLNLEEADNNPLRWSDEVFWIFGYEPKGISVSRSNFLKCVHPEDRPRVQATLAEAIQERRAYQIDHRIIRPDGSERVVHEHAELVHDPVTGQPLKLVGTVQDITERIRLEESLRQAQKMEGVGTLAGGIAHDFNNLLTVIQGHAQILKAQTNLPPTIFESVQEIAAAAERAENLTRQLLTFSRKQPMQVKRLSLNIVVSQMSKMLRRIIGEDVNLECRLAPKMPSVMADIGMLEQVLMNLTVNARDAMPKGGTVIISTHQRAIDNQHARLFPQARPGTFCCLEVADTGCGIAPDLLARIFDPFFTTKAPGKGTGLGLSTVYAIAQQHHGWVEVESELNQGTQFRILLPAAGDEPDVQVGVPGETGLANTTGSETILVVEDEGPVRLLITKYLRRQGYQLYTAANAGEALDIWPEIANQVDLLLTDLVMPGGMNGRELAQRLVEAKPELRVIFMSGYSMNVVDQDELAEGINYLPKPFQPQKLGQMIRQRLG